MNEQTEAGDPTVLTCWKEIAQYLGKGVRTVQRWEQEFGLPVRRPNGIEHKSAVFAYRNDVDEWLKSTWSKRNRVIENDEKPNGRLGSLIHLSQELRSTHVLLMHQTTAALAALVDNCNQLAMARDDLSRVPSAPQVEILGSEILKQRAN